MVIRKECLKIIDEKLKSSETKEAGRKPCQRGRRHRLQTDG